MPATIESKPSSLGEAFAQATADGRLSLSPDKAAPESAPSAKQEPAKEAVKEPVKEPAKEAKPSVEQKTEVPHGTENPNLAPKKAPETPPTPNDEEPPKGMTKEAQQAFAEKRKALSAAEKQIEAISAEREALKAKLDEAATSAPEIQRLKAELEEMKKVIAANEDEIAISRIESTKQFKEAVAAPMSEVEEITGRLAESYALSASAILDAIKEPNASKRADAIEEIASEFKAYDRDELIGAAKTYAKAQKIAEELRGNAKKKLEEIAARTQQEDQGSMTATVEEYKGAVSQEFKALQAKFPHLGPVEGADQWNAYLAGIERKAQSIDVNNISAAEVARHVARSHALDEEARVREHYQKREVELTEKLEKAEARIKEYIQTEPGAGSGHNENGNRPAVTEGATMGERIAGRIRTDLPR